MAENLKSKHAFGRSENVDAAIAAGKIDARDILFLDEDTEPKIGWLDENGNKIIVEDKEQIIRVDELPTADGDENVVYIYNNEGYIWNGTECVPLSQATDVTELTNKITNLETTMETKVDEATVEIMIETAVAEASGVEVVEF